MFGFGYGEGPSRPIVPGPSGVPNAPARVYAPDGQPASGSQPSKAGDAYLTMNKWQRRRAARLARAAAASAPPNPTL